MVRRLMEPRDAGGIWKLLPRWRSMKKACTTAKVQSLERARKQVIPDIHIGIILIRHLASSIRCTLDSRQGFAALSSSGSLIAALFKALRKKKKIPVEFKVLIQKRSKL